MLRYEYKVLTFYPRGLLLGSKLDTDKMEQVLNEWAEEGWRVLSIFTTQQHYSGTRQVVVILERPRSL
ncbi:MAG: DUF4177 domain-containing protein [Thermogemmata sp.]|jgi:hypothetical protein|uniref:DUF4177 domain-containing protein n=1 Tax=Thermogemmata fonticola TaxID=2755323 RepID=A0A7V8VFY8_9BACT|nr:DUF4177 domain-containing protein [Thermogemmata fonticola]MBA2227082.1 DUF4177 domain-containing protein [Thermogemmata fonticola]MCX8138360.1 DUF4177 domain-containing protein [Gemmataceae bacterium]GIW85530.1 MAG: hypothetical protein KatS3mg107_1190 [Gemmataceae bacterium]